MVLEFHCINVLWCSVSIPFGWKFGLLPCCSKYLSVFVQVILWNKFLEVDLLGLCGYHMLALCSLQGQPAACWCPIRVLLGPLPLPINTNAGLTAKPTNVWTGNHPLIISLIHYLLQPGLGLVLGS